MSLELIEQWQPVDSSMEHPNIGVLKATNNRILFSIRDVSNPLQEIFMCHSGLYNYKLYTSGIVGYNSNQTEYYAKKLIMYNNNDFDEFSDKKHIYNICQVRFEIPQLHYWLNQQGFKIKHIENQIFLKTLPVESITLKASSPKITINYVSPYPYYFDGDPICSLQNSPYVTITYDTPVDDTTIISDIHIITKFLGLLIGKITTIENISLKIATSELPVFLFLNDDFSFNTRYFNRPYTFDFNCIKNNLAIYFDNWYSFYLSKDYQLILDAYFYCNGRERIANSIDTIFLIYCRFFDAYTSREANINDFNISTLENSIFQILTSNNIEDSITELFSQHDLSYNAENLTTFINQQLTVNFRSDLCKLLKSEPINSELKTLYQSYDTHYTAKNIARKLACIARDEINYETRLKNLNDKFYNVLSNCSNHLSSINAPEQIFKYIANTRNFYAHFKSDDSETLSLADMVNSIPSFELLVLTIIFTKIGMDSELIISTFNSSTTYAQFLSSQK